MRDRDQGFGTLAQALAVKIRDSVFGDDVMHIAPRGYYARSWIEYGHDARNSSVLGRGWQRDDGLAAFGASRAAHEIHLPAESAIGLDADGIGAYLAGEIHLNGGIDGDHAVVLGDHKRIICIGCRMHLEQRVLVDVLEQALGAEDESDHDFAAMNVFALAGEGAGFEKIDHAVGTHFAVDSDGLPIAQVSEHGIGNAADTGLEHGAVGNQRGNLSGDAILHRRGVFGGKLEQRTVRFHHGRNLADVQEAIAEGARHLVVHFGDDVAGALGGGEAAIHAGAEAQESMFIRRAGLHEGGVERQLAGAEEVLNFAQEDGRVIGAAFLNGLADVAAEEQAVVAEMAFVFRASVGGVAECQHVDELDVVELVGAEHESVDQRLGRAAAFPEPDAVAGGDEGDGFFGGDDLGSELSPGAHKIEPLASGCPCRLVVFL